MSEPDADTYALKSVTLGEVAAPALPYQPPAPRSYRPRIGVIGAGGIVSAHLDAYRSAGWQVAAICNRSRAKAEAKAREFAPDARVTDRIEDVLSDPAIDVVDITPHPADRLPIIEAALRAGKHVLSQKPFVLDLVEGERLIALAHDNGVKLAVNQNGRWAPHLSWMREAGRAGLIGDVISVHCAVHWNHGWIAGTPFEKIEDLILYDFGIHWFDFIRSVTGNRAQSVIAMANAAVGQQAAAPLLAQVLILMDQGQASLVFDGATPHGPRDTTYIAGTKGGLCSDGPDLGNQTITLTTAAGIARPILRGIWFNDGFRGAMGALLVAIEDDAEPANGAAENLHSLAFAFAAIQSRRTGREVTIASELLKQVGISKNIPPSTPISALSGGERQAVAIARAMHFDSDLIILDEPTNNLGVAETQGVLKFVRTARDTGHSCVFIAHNIHHVFQVVDRIAVMRLGTVVVDDIDPRTTTVEQVERIITGMDH
jgi:predicted dehydrogenase